MLTKNDLGFFVSIVLVAAACGDKGSSDNTGGAATGGTGTGNGTATGGSTAGGTGGATSSSGHTSTSSSGTTTSSSSGTTSSSSGTTSSSSGTTSSGSAPMAGGCPVFLSTSPWNKDISGVNVNAADQSYLAKMSTSTHLHPDFGSTFGIPYQYVSSSITKSSVAFNSQAASESDPGPYPIPTSPKIEVGDGHMLLVDTGACVLYELSQANKQGSAWHAYAGAIWDLKTNSTRPTCWTSADAAGLPIFPGLARYEEAKAGAIDHALRFTMNNIQEAFTPPASHFSNQQTSTSYPPFGLHLRLKSTVNINAATPQAKIVLTALKKYGMVLADFGSDWYISGALDPNWSDNDLNYIKGLTGSDFEVLPHGSLTPASGCP